MKKIIALITALLILLSFVGCGNKEEAKGDGLTKMFDYEDLSVYIDVPEYKGIKVSSEDEEFVKLLADQMASDLSGAGYGEEVEIASGAVENGDTVHIVYVGKHKGEAFSGGSTGDEGTDLVIGSGSYIDGFESGLIGAKPGETRVLNLTFPDPYPNNEELSGEKVEFTVTVQKIKRTQYPEIDAEVAKKLGYDSVSAYNEAAFTKTVEGFLYTKIVNGTKTKKVPQAELDYFVENDIKYYKNYASQVGYTFEQFLQAYNMNEETFRKQISESYKENMKSYMVIYYIAKAEKLTVSPAELEEKYKSLATEYSMEIDAVKKEIDEKQIEYSMLYENVLKFLAEKAEIVK